MTPLAVATGGYLDSPLSVATSGYLGAVLASVERVIHLYGYGLRGQTSARLARSVAANTTVSRVDPGAVLAALADARALACAHQEQVARGVSAAREVSGVDGAERLADAGTDRRLHVLGDS